MEGSSKGDDERGFAALFNEFVFKVQNSSAEEETTNSDPEDDKESEEKNKDEKDSMEGESSRSGQNTEVPLSEDSSDKKMESSEHEKVVTLDKESSDHEKVETLDKDCPQTSSKCSSAMESTVIAPAIGSEENVIPDADLERSKQLVQGSSSQESSPRSVHQESSPVPSNSDSSYQTSPASSTFSSRAITPASSPLTTLQSRSTILSAASSKLSSSSARKLPPKVEKPVLRDRSGRRRYNSLESEYVVNIDVKRERSKSGSAGQSRRRSAKLDKEGPKYRNEKEKHPPKTEERKRPQEKVMRPGLEFEVGFKLEAMDFCQNKWYSAKIVQVDEEEQQVLIHFEKWNSRYDEWVDCESERLRPLVRQSTRKEALPQQHPTGEYKYGEEVLARWSDCRYYPAKVLNLNKNGTYRMLFYDGIEKNVLATNIRVMPDELKAQNFFSNFTLPAAPPVRGKKRWFAREDVVSATTEQPENTTEPATPTTTMKRRLSGPVSPLSPPSVPPKKVRVDEKVKSPKEVKAPKTKIAASPVSEDIPPESQATPAVGTPILVDPKPVLKPVLSSAKMEELISRNIKEPLLNDKDLGLLRDRRKTFLAPKELVIDLDHNKYKCDVKGCDKSFRKSTLLEYHKKYYHATKTSTSSAASRVLHRTRKMMTTSGTSGFNKTRSDARRKRRPKRIRRKRSSAPADLVSSYPTRRADRGLGKKRVGSPDAVPENEVQTPALTDRRRRSRLRHHSAPLETKDIQTRIKPSQPKNTVSEPKVEDPVKPATPSGTTEVPVNPTEVAPAKKLEEVAPQTDEKDVEMKSPPVTYDPSHDYAKKPEEPTSILKHALDTSREQAGETVREEVTLVRGMKSILKDVSMLQEEIRKEEEKHRHRRKHKKNKDRKRRKKKKKDKEKKRRTKGKEKTGVDGSDEDTETDEEDGPRREERKLPLSDDTPSRVLFKQPGQVSGVRLRPTTVFKSLVGVDDDVIKCVCKNTQEEGFMIQCEVCNCWQHSKCVGLCDKSVPKTYTCFYCHVSKGGMPPFYDSEAYEWFDTGNLPRFPDFGKERDHQQDKSAKLFRLTTNSLIADLLMLAEVLQGLEHKISILESPDHPEAKLWAKDWILMSRKKTAPKLPDSWMSDDLASTLREMFLLGKLPQQGEEIHLGEGSESSDLLPSGVGPNTGERDEGSVGSNMDDGYEKDPSKHSDITTRQNPVADSTVEVVLSGGDGLSDGKKGVEVPKAAIHGESSSFVGTAGAGTSGLSSFVGTAGASTSGIHRQGGQSTSLDGAVVSASSKDVRTELEGVPQTPTAVAQSESPSASTSQEPSGGTSKADNIVNTSSSLDGAVAKNVVMTETGTKQTEEGQGGTIGVPSSGVKNDGNQDMDEKSEPTRTTVSPPTEVELNIDTVAGNTDNSVPSSRPTESSHQNTGASSTSKSLEVTSGSQDSQTVSSVDTPSSVLKEDLPSTGQNTAVSSSKQEIGVVSSNDKSVSHREVSCTDHSPVTDSSEPSTVEVPHEQETNSSKLTQSSQPEPVEGQDAPNVDRTETKNSDQSSPSVNTDSKNVADDERVVKSNDSGELVTASDSSVGLVATQAESPASKPSSVGLAATQAESPATKPSEGKEVVLNVEDVIRRQMTKDNPGPSRGNPGPSRGTEIEMQGEGVSSAAAPPQETERQEDEAMDVDNTISQGKDAKSSVESATKSTNEIVRAEEGLEDVNVELSQAYLLRHVNTLHDQLTERMSLIEMEVEKLEKMFFSSASEWQAITQDPTVMKKKLRVLLGDLHKINTIVSL